jgi:hypothetical protein
MIGSTVRETSNEPDTFASAARALLCVTVRRDSTRVLYESTTIGSPRRLTQEEFQDLIGFVVIDANGRSILIQDPPRESSWRPTIDEYRRGPARSGSVTYTLVVSDSTVAEGGGSSDPPP